MVASILALLLIGVLTFLFFLLIYKIAGTNKLFCFIKEGTGVFIMDGEKLNRVLLCYHGHKCVVNADGNWEIMKGEPDRKYGFLGLLERKFGIYWVGIPPWSKVGAYKFRWNELNKKSNEEIPVRREEMTNFFYAQTIPYFLELKGAETGGNMEGSQVGGNVSVNIGIVILIEMVFPEIAVFKNKNWFDQLGSVVLDHARLYVGKGSYEDLRTQESSTGEALEDGEHAFSKYVLLLNKYAPVGGPTDNVLTKFGVRIVGAQVTTVDLSGASKELAAATTAGYVAQKEAEAIKLKADGEAYAIREKGQAEADKVLQLKKAEAQGISERIEAIGKHGDLGKFVLKQDKQAEAGSAGSVIIYDNTDGKEKGPQIVLPVGSRTG